MKTLLPRLCALWFLLLAAALLSAAEPVAPARPALRVLLITGGCCHDYDWQTYRLTSAMRKFADVNWTIVNEGGNGTRAMIPLYDNPNWAAPYDVIVHNECFADTDDPAYLRKITAAHRAGKPAVVIHCAMHSYRAATADDWREFLGVTSRRHGKADRHVVTPANPGHPAMKDFPATWTTPVDELYVIEKVWPGTTALATAIDPENGQTYPVAWVHDYHGTRVFGTTFGHGNATWDEPAFIALVCRGLLWAAGREP